MAYEPQSLDKLPEYLKNAKEKGVGEGAPVFDMGQIIVPKRSYWKWSFAIIMSFVLGFGALATYDKVSTNEFTVVVDVNKDTPNIIPEIVSDSGGQIVAVTHKEDSTYEVKVATKKPIQSFVEWLRSHKNIKKAELGE